MYKIPLVNTTFICIRVQAFPFWEEQLGFVRQLDTLKKDIFPRQYPSDIDVLSPGLVTPDSRSEKFVRGGNLYLFVLDEAI